MRVERCTLLSACDPGSPFGCSRRDYTAKSPSVKYQRTRRRHSSFSSQLARACTSLQSEEIDHQAMERVGRIQHGKVTALRKHNFVDLWAQGPERRPGGAGGCSGSLAPLTISVGIPVVLERRHGPPDLLRHPGSAPRRPGQWNSSRAAARRSAAPRHPVLRAAGPGSLRRRACVVRGLSPSGRLTAMRRATRCGCMPAKCSPTRAPRPCPTRAMRSMPISSRNEPTNAA